MHEFYFIIYNKKVFVIGITLKTSFLGLAAFIIELVVF